jgi:hypothetical protein
MSQTLSEPLDQLVESLLWEGYALYPYTPGATKNATPTPFGIVYPPLYAIGAPSTFDHLELRCVLDCPSSARLEGEVRFLAGGSRCSPPRRRPPPMPRSSTKRRRPATVDP